MTVVDLGCGYGFFAIPAAKIVGPGGKVIGVDVDSEWLGQLRENGEREGLGNIEIVLGRAEETIPCRGCADVVFLGMVLHDFEDPARVLANVSLMLKPGGTLADLDWKKEYRGIGPPSSIRFDEAKATRMMEEKGFELVSALDQGPYHYLMLARRPGRTPARRLP